ncbi:hypothetical protein N7539_006995 [Penicillium diatomitis]|uniref:Calcineurin-like phosphoesterase domain-containing protein n=1 Tax=Penicillium diatomitis TaxID=2819901 RepID=A0A9X0BSX8_9EURO|nr:uncharacterized protein N7539_006995 [Penicillium diatomitis]KAJ5481101.1 hypothetical protein N7539_006995 [Penicillium diatomitis]
MAYYEAIQKVMGLGSKSQSESSPRLEFTKNGTFHISVFNDLHFAEGKWDRESCESSKSRDAVALVNPRMLMFYHLLSDADNDVKTQDVISKLIGMEKPEFIVVNGDLISGEATRSSNADQFIDQVLKPLKKADIPWASTYGNHDSDANLDPVHNIYNHEKTYKKSLTKSMIRSPTAGVTNYYLPVYAHGASDETPALIMWFFDSRGVVKWFKEKSSNLTEEYGKTIPSLAFYHIPAHAMAKYQDDYYDNRTTPGINGERVVAQGAGATDYTGQDTRFMQALLDTPGLMATFSGHDHLNDWCFKWNNGIEDQNLTGNGLNMCYGRRTGYGGYGDVARGGRQILLHEKHMAKAIDTWVRLEDGSVSSAITLNATYGEDQYNEMQSSILRVVTSGTSDVHSASLLPVMLFWMFMIGLQYMRRIY